MAKPRFYCTLADRNYLVRVLALNESLGRHERNEYVLFLVCLDELTRTILRALNLPRVVLVALYALEKGDQALLATRADRTLAEYYWTLTPTLILRLIERHPEIDVLTYLDADLFFFSSPDPVFEELGARSILIHEHRYSRELAWLEPDYGRFNVGLLCFRRDEEGLAALHWWRDRCLEWCFDRVEEGKMGDQKYLDDWPRRFGNLAILRNPGAGVAPWNQAQYDICPGGDGSPTVNGRPLVFYHFHGLAMLHRCMVVPCDPIYPVTETILRTCYVPYAEALWQQTNQVTALAPTFGFGLAKALTLTHKHAVLIRQGAPTLDLGPVPRRRFPINDTWLAHCGHEDPLLLVLGARPIARTLVMVHQMGARRLRRADFYFLLFPNLQQVWFLDPGDADFEAWRSQQIADPRVRIIGPDPRGSPPREPAATGFAPQVYPNLPAPDVLIVDAEGAVAGLAGLSATQKQRVRVLYARVDLEGEHPLEDLKRMLEPEMVFVAFAPLSPNQPNQGNALFVNRDSLPLLRRPEV